MKRTKTLFGFESLFPAYSDLKVRFLPSLSKTGRFPAFSSSFRVGTLWDTLMSPVKSPVGPNGLEGALLSMVFSSFGSVSRVLSDSASSASVEPILVNLMMKLD